MRGCQHVILYSTSVLGHRLCTVKQTGGASVSFFTPLPYSDINFVPSGRLGVPACHSLLHFCTRTSVLYYQADWRCGTSLLFPLVLLGPPPSLDSSRFQFPILLEEDNPSPRLDTSRFRSPFNGSHPEISERQIGFSLKNGNLGLTNFAKKMKKRQIGVSLTMKPPSNRF